MAKGKQKHLLSQRLEKDYTLCNHCFYRQLEQTKGISKRSKRKVRNSVQCYICSGLMSHLDRIIKLIGISVGKKYEFYSFLIGATLPRQIYEREDKIRARYKLRGRESIKKQFVKELGTKFTRITKMKLEHIIPDIRINVVIDSKNDIFVNAKTSPLILIGHYVKRNRGLPQKKVKCTNCFGTGCSTCNYSGAALDNTIEGLIATRILLLTHGQNPKFLWVGSEDPDSLVLGKGRPFFLQISNPRIRSLKTNLRFRANGICVMINGKLNYLPEQPVRFTTKTKILVRSSAEVSKFDLSKLNVLRDSLVTFEIRSRLVRKKIYSIRTLQINDKEFILVIDADGGFAIKQFVGGQRYTKPNVSEIIGTKCECVLFDILDVSIQ